MCIAAGAPTGPHCCCWAALASAAALAHRHPTSPPLCAHRNGAKVMLYESEEACGGHTLTDTSSGFPVDLGFQVRGWVLATVGAGGRSTVDL